jgi:uncharacterized protein HemY
MTIELWTLKALRVQLDEVLSDIEENHLRLLIARGRITRAEKQLKAIRSQLTGHKEEATLYGGKLPTDAQIEENEMAEIPTGEV